MLSRSGEIFRTVCCLRPDVGEVEENLSGQRSLGGLVEISLALLFDRLRAALDDAFLDS